MIENIITFVVVFSVALYMFRLAYKKGLERGLRK